jgi:glucoamylase
VLTTELSTGRISEWVAERRRGAARALGAAISATHLEHHRAGFGWTVRPAAGSVLASPNQACWDPEPDYFHHWVRDAAMAIRVLPEVLEIVDPDERPWWRQAFRDHVRFSLAISDPGRRGPAANPVGPATRPGHRRYLRPDAELRALGGPAWLDEPRFAADGGPDLERWNRPQDDGPALRASACLAVIGALPELADPEVEALLRRDLVHVRRVAGRPSIGPWEDGPARRTGFTLIAQWDALDRGAMWLEGLGEAAAADDLRAAAAAVILLIGETADADTGVWRESIEAAPGMLDSATALAILHAGRTEGPLALTAPRTLGTAAALERLFGGLYPINRGRAVPAIGRFAGDTFFGGNPWYPVTLGFAELHYRIAAETGDPEAFAKAEAWMALIGSVAPDGDALPEQFDRETGVPVSCRGLTWSAAAFIGAAAARERALMRPAPDGREPPGHRSR